MIPLRGRPFVALALLMLAVPALAQVEVPGLTRTLFSDAFAGSTLDQRRWFANVPERVTLADGALHLAGGSVVSNETFRFGRISIRARFPTGDGARTTLALRVPNTSLAPGEIDLAEEVGSDPRTVRSGVRDFEDGREVSRRCTLLGERTPNPFADGASCSHASNGIGRGTDFSAGYHAFAIEWSPDHLTWTIDGAPYASLRTRIPNVPMAVLLRVQSGTAASRIAERATLDVDSVKVEQL